MLGLQKFIYLSYESYVISCEVGIMLDWYDDMFTMLGVSDRGIRPDRIIRMFGSCLDKLVG